VSSVPFLSFPHLFLVVANTAHPPPLPTKQYPNIVPLQAIVGQGAATSVPGGADAQAAAAAAAAGGANTTTGATNATSV